MDDGFDIHVLANCTAVFIFSTSFYQSQGLLEKAAAYLNVDSAVSGPLLMLQATPSLAGLVTGVLADVQDPKSGSSLLEAWSGDMGVLGSGSDYAGG